MHKGMGLVRNVFNNDNIRNLKGNLGIGHNRYSTKATSEQINCQPFVVHSMHGALAVAHNGELVNCSVLRKMVRIEVRYYYVTFWLLYVETIVLLHFLSLNYRAQKNKTSRCWQEVWAFQLTPTASL